MSKYKESKKDNNIEKLEMMIVSFFDEFWTYKSINVPINGVSKSSKAMFINLLTPISHLHQ